MSLHDQSDDILDEAVAAAGVDEVPGSTQPKAFLPLFILCWFGLNLALYAAVGGAIPRLFALLNNESKGVNLSIVLAVGGLIVMIVTPLAGRFSDRTMSRLGKRRPWIVGGAAIGFAGMVILAFAGNLWTVIIGWAIAQIGYGATNAAIHALLADQIPTRTRARVAGIASAAGGIALIAGAAVVAALPIDQQWSWFIVPGALGSITSALLFFGLRDIVREQRPPRWGWRDLLSTYWLNPVRYRDFFWAFTCRLLVTMSIVSVSAYLLFFIVDRMHVPIAQASGVQTVTLLAFTVLNVITTLVFAWISDRTGRRKPIVWISGLLSAIGLIIAIIAPDLGVFMIAMAFVGAAQGAYASVDIALMTEVLPTFKDAGKDLGIVSLSFQLPQVLVPIVAVPLLAIGDGDNYTALFIAAIIFGALGALAVLPIKSVR